MDKQSMTVIKNANDENWFASEIKKSTVVEVSFSDGTKNRYAGDASVNVGDTFIVGPGCKSAFAIGSVTKVAPKSGGTSHLARSVLAFKKNPAKSDIKKCFDHIKPIKTMKDIESFLAYDYPGACFYTADEILVSDILIKNLLNAITILTYPALATHPMLDAAKKCLSDKIAIPGVMFGAEMNEKFADEFVTIGFSGYYPGWKEELQALPVWTEAAGPADSAGPEENLHTEGEIGLMVYEFTGGAEVKSIFENNAEFQNFFSKLVCKSVFAILIRAGANNLLKTAMSAGLPVSAYMDEIHALPKQLGIENAEDSSKNVAPKEKLKVSSNFTIKVSYRGTAVTVSAEKKDKQIYIGDRCINHYPFLKDKGKSNYEVVEELILPDIIKNYSKFARVVMSDNFGSWFSYTWNDIILNGGYTKEDAAALHEIREKFWNDSKVCLTPTGKKKAAPLLEKRIPIEQCLIDFFDYLNALYALTEQDLYEFVRSMPMIKDGSRVVANRKHAYPCSTKYYYGGSCSFYQYALTFHTGKDNKMGVSISPVYG